MDPISPLFRSSSGHLTLPPPKLSSTPQPRLSTSTAATNRHQAPRPPSRAPLHTEYKKYKQALQNLTLTFSRQEDPIGVNVGDEVSLADLETLAVQRHAVQRDTLQRHYREAMRLWRLKESCRPPARATRVASECKCRHPSLKTKSPQQKPAIEVPITSGATSATVLMQFAALAVEESFPPVSSWF
ncbi:hypothetical protein BC830DRAFT_1113849 [Chytriomyces sp. MP71]|nr:hypothetical protein BC830DRAFT_1113849 [Chytriomyces sp. MP71]